MHVLNHRYLVLPFTATKMSVFGQAKSQNGQLLFSGEGMDRNGRFCEARIRVAQGQQSPALLEHMIM